MKKRIIKTLLALLVVLALAGGLLYCGILLIPDGPRTWHFYVGIMCAIWGIIFIVLLLLFSRAAIKEAIASD